LFRFGRGYAGSEHHTQTASRYVASSATTA
jgi:hypothetical protein